MARKPWKPKKTKAKATTARADAKFSIIHFIGGPRDGEFLRVSNPIPPRMRLALPEWAQYYQIDDTKDYECRDEPWEPNVGS